MSNFRKVTINKSYDYRSLYESINNIDGGESYTETHVAKSNKTTKK